MWNYYLCRRESHVMPYSQPSDGFPAGRISESHMLHLDSSADCEVIAAIRFFSPAYQDAFETEPGVISFPHVYNFATKIGPTVAAKLVAHGVLETHTTHQTMLILAKNVPPLDPRFKNHSRVF